MNGGALETATRRSSAHLDEISLFAPHERGIYRPVLVVRLGCEQGEYVDQAFGLNNLVGATPRTSRRRPCASCPIRCSTAPT